MSNVVKQYIFQGLPIAVETKRGSDRNWFDPHNNTAGTTHMKNDYGYIKGTLGTDGDAVDVYIGPNPHSTRVFVITQAKAPEFIEVDEQKCMVGFDTPEAAKHCYLQHYNNTKFFMNMKELDIIDFKDKLATSKGKLLKHMSDDLDKSLSAVIAAFIRNQQTIDNRYAAKVAQEQPGVGTNREFNPVETPVVPIRRIDFQTPLFSIKPCKEPK